MKAEIEAGEMAPREYGWVGSLGLMEEVCGSQAYNYSSVEVEADEAVWLTGQLA